MQGVLHSIQPFRVTFGMNRSGGLTLPHVPSHSARQQNHLLINVPTIPIHKRYMSCTNSELSLA